MNHKDTLIFHKNTPSAVLQLRPRAGKVGETVLPTRLRRDLAGGDSRLEEHLPPVAAHDLLYSAPVPADRGDDLGEDAWEGWIAGCFDTSWLGQLSFGVWTAVVAPKAALPVVRKSSQPLKTRLHNAYDEAQGSLSLRYVLILKTGDPHFFLSQD